MSCLSKFFAIGLGLVSSMALVPVSVHAETRSAPAMLGVKEIVLQFARISNSKAANECGLAREDIALALTRAFGLEGITVIPVQDAKPPSPSVARMDLFPELAVLNGASGDCTAWVALNAQATAVARIPPIELPRNILVTYWRSGQIVTSGQSSHARIVQDVLQKLARDFARQYTMDQPPPLPNLEDTGTREGPNLLPARKE